MDLDAQTSAFFGGGAPSGGNGVAAMRASMGTLPPAEPDDVAEIDKEMARNPASRSVLAPIRANPRGAANDSLDAQTAAFFGGSDQTDKAAPGGSTQAAAPNKMAEATSNLSPNQQLVVGAGEAARNWVTGLVGQVAGGWRATLGLLPGQDFGTAVRAGQDLAENIALSGSPETNAGKAISQIPGKALAAVEKGINYAGNKATGGNVPDIGTIVTHPSETGSFIGGDIGKNVEANLPASYRGRIAPILAAAGAAAPVAAATVDSLGGAARSAIDAAKNPAVRRLISGDGATVTGNGVVSPPASEVKAPLDQGGGNQPESGRPMAGGGAAVANSNPYPALTGQEDVRGVYPTVKLSKIGADVPQAEQAVRSKIAGEIQPDTERVRSGVITGNEDTLRNEYTAAKAPNPTPAGQLLKQQIADEQTALSNYAQQRVDATGANPHFVDDYQRGEFINGVMTGHDGLSGFLNDQTKALYDEAKARVGDNPVQASNLDALVNSPQFKAELKLKGIPDFTSGLSDLSDVHKTTGFEGTAPNSIAGLEKMRQSLNQQWSPANKYAIGRAVDAIDQDMATAGGPDLYEKARALHAAKKTLFGSKGIQTLFGDVDPNGVQTATEFGQIPKKLNNMPLDQWRHIYDTADSLSRGQVRGAQGLQVPSDLQSAAQQMKNEMGGSLAREVYAAGADKAGVWNQNSANKIMNARARKIGLAMPPMEQEAFHTLNLGGQIMPGVHSYEGAGLQTSRMNQMSLMEKHAPAAGALLGEASHLPGMSWVGEKAGEKLQGALGGKRLMKEARALDAQMESNAKLGSIMKAP